MKSPIRRKLRVLDSIPQSHTRNRTLQKPSAHQGKQRQAAIPVAQMVKTKTVNGKRVVLPGIVQAWMVEGDSYTISSLARKLRIPTTRVREAIFRREIDAVGTKSGKRTRWAISWTMAHRMAKIVGADPDRLWENGKRTAQLLKAMRRHADVSKYFMRPIRLPWLDRLLKCSRGTIVVGLRLRILAGMTMLDNTKKIEERFVVTVDDLAAICEISEPAVKVALRKLREAKLIESKKRGRAASVFRVLDAAPPIKQKTSSRTTQE